MPPTSSTGAAIASLQATTDHLRLVTSQQATTHAAFLHNSTSTNAAVISIQSSLHEIMLQLGRLQKSPAYQSTTYTAAPFTLDIQPSPIPPASSPLPNFSSPYLPNHNPSFTPQPQLSLFKLPQSSPVSAYHNGFATISTVADSPVQPIHRGLPILTPSSTHLAMELTTLPPLPSFVLPHPPLLAFPPQSLLVIPSLSLPPCPSLAFCATCTATF